MEKLSFRHTDRHTLSGPVAVPGTVK